MLTLFRLEMEPLTLFSLDVLEHLKNPKKAIREIHRVLKVGGLVAVSLPLENLFQRLSRIASD